MNTPAHTHYQRIAQALAFVQTHHRAQPNLAAIAAHVGLSPFHFQRLFVDWVGTTPKKFLQYTTLAHAKALLQTSGESLLNVACDAGLSGSGRLHDLFVGIEAMTPGQYRRGGADLLLRYRMAPTPFGPALLCSSDRGLVALVFGDTESTTLPSVQARLPNARYVRQDDAHQAAALQIFNNNWHDSTQWPQLRLHLKGTAFQLKVWEALLRIPASRLTSYGQIAAHIGQPQAVRAVGTAVGANPVAYLIPCHRVIAASGLLGGYRWGLPRKLAMLGWEGVRSGA